MKDNQLYFPKRQEAHQKKVFWQIWFPLILTCLLVAAVGIFVIVATAQDSQAGFNTKWANISLIYMILPMMISALLFFALVAGSIYLLIKTYQTLPTYSQKALYYLKMASFYIKVASQKVSSPIISIKSALAGLRELFHKLT